MRHKYVSHAFVLARTPLKESGALLTLLTEDLGLVRARTEGLRKPGAKLAHALQTFSECDTTLLRGKDGWRLSGAILIESWARTLAAPARVRAARIATLLLRMVHGEANDPALFDTFFEFIRALPDLSETEQDAAECLVALRLLKVLGLDAGVLPEGADRYTAEVLTLSPEVRRDLILRVNRGIAASGL